MYERVGDRIGHDFRGHRGVGRVVLEKDCIPAGEQSIARLRRDGEPTMRRIRRGAVVLAPFILLSMTGCASVPEETVTLSMAVGQDIQQLHSGYRETIRFSFAQMRKAGLTVIDNVWTPAYLKRFVATGQLVEAAKNGQTERIEYWARLAIDAIDKKRREFVQPLQKREAALIAEVDAAFDRVINANAAVTANLNSVLKVRDLQDQVVDLLGLTDVRNTINSAIVAASDEAAEAALKIGSEAAALASP